MSMAASEPVVLSLVEKDTLFRCGGHWGEETVISEENGVSELIGETDWFETAVAGAIGLDGRHPGKGPGIIIKDVDKSNIEILWTNALTGCMGLAILGTDKIDGTRDAFFAHARHYDKDRAVEEVDNPMRLAHEFVNTHTNIRVFWGTDIFFGRSAAEGDAARREAQRKLSRELGCWVRENDFVMSRELTFFPNWV